MEGASLGEWHKVKLGRREWEMGRFFMPCRYLPYSDDAHDQFLRHTYTLIHTQFLHSTLILIYEWFWCIHGPFFYNKGSMTKDEPFSYYLKVEFL